MLPDLECRHALLLQGPNGPFFKRFAGELHAAGIAVTKVNFHPGDDLFYRGPDVVRFRGAPESWGAFVGALMAERDIDAVFVFGDCRPIHAAAIAIARDRGIAVWVFEEGYLRPDWITLERDGVNGNSRMPKDPEHYRRLAATLPEVPNPEPVGPVFAVSAHYTALNATAMTVARWWLYPRYRHHRPLNAFAHAAAWVRGGFRKLRFARQEQGILARLETELSGKFFFVPLQVHRDYQLSHSRFRDIPELIREVVAAFAAHAPGDHALVIKHHPADRPYREYGKLIRELRVRHGLGERLIYVHDLHLPTLFTHAKATITMNSTVGLSSIHRGVPTKTLGIAVYDFPGLTHQGALASFFVDPGAVDMRVYRAFRKVLLWTSQANGSVWKRLPGRARGAGVRWFGAREDRVSAGPRAANLKFRANRERG